jgi:hypothetical protein
MSDAEPGEKMLRDRYPNGRYRPLDWLRVPQERRRFAGFNAFQRNRRDTRVSFCAGSRRRRIRTEAPAIRINAVPPGPFRAALWIALVALFALMLAGPMQQTVSLHAPPGDGTRAIHRRLAAIPNPWPWQVSAGLALAVLLVLGIGRQHGPNEPVRSEAGTADADKTGPESAD